MERRKSLRIEEKDLGINPDDDKSFGLSTTEQEIIPSKYSARI